MKSKGVFYIDESFSNKKSRLMEFSHLDRLLGCKHRLLAVTQQVPSSFVMEPRCQMLPVWNQLSGCVQCFSAFRSSFWMFLAQDSAWKSPSSASLSDTSVEVETASKVSPVFSASSRWINMEQPTWERNALTPLILFLHLP